jgi:2-oxoglutarate dehydrogenase complex dehydrogenase (E1) component-like enzyme
MEQIFKNQYIVIEADRNKSFLKMTWQASSELIADQEFQECMLMYAQKIEELACRSVMSDARKFLYLMSPEIQEWVNVHIRPYQLRAGTQKIAFLHSEDFVTQVAIEQMTEEVELIAVQHFNNEREALEWLFF